MRLLQLFLEVKLENTIELGKSSGRKHNRGNTSTFYRLSKFKTNRIHLTKKELTPEIETLIHERDITDNTGKIILPMKGKKYIKCKLKRFSPGYKTKIKNEDEVRRSETGTEKNIFWESLYRVKPKKSKTVPSYEKIKYL